MMHVQAGGPEARLDAVLERCHAAASDPTAPAQENLPDGFIGTLGHFPVYFPEEIAHAGGLLPIAVLGGGNRIEMRHADARMGSFVCSICRSSVELGLNGGMQPLTGLVTSQICDAAKHLSGIWTRNLPEQLSQILYLPQNVNTSGAVDFIADEMRRLKGELERRCGRVIDDAALRASIRIYNENGRLLRELYRIRREAPWLVSCTEAYLLLRARGRMPCEQHSELLRKALEAIRERPAAAQDKPRVVLVGGFCEQPPLEMLEAIDDACFVVDDDLLIGMRWFTDDIDESGDPLLALADGYVHRSAASPVQHDALKPKEAYLLAMLRQAGADAAILTAAKFCEPGLDEQLAWWKHLEQEGIPHLVLEFEEKMTSFEQLAMQVETFAESLLFAPA